MTFVVGLNNINLVVGEAASQCRSRVVVLVCTGKSSKISDVSKVFARASQSVRPDQVVPFPVHSVFQYHLYWANRLRPSKLQLVKSVVSAPTVS